MFPQKNIPGFPLEKSFGWLSRNVPDASSNHRLLGRAIISWQATGVANLELQDFVAGIVLPLYDSNRFMEFCWPQHPKMRKKENIKPNGRNSSNSNTGRSVEFATVRHTKKYSFLITYAIAWVLGRLIGTKTSLRSSTGICLNTVMGGSIVQATWDSIVKNKEVVPSGKLS